MTASRPNDPSSLTRPALSGALRRRGGRWFFALALVVAAGVLFPAVSAASSTPVPPSIIDATTGLPDASSVAPVNACAPATSVTATCLAQVLAVRGTRSFVHPRLRTPSSPFRLVRHRGRNGATTLEIPAANTPQPGTPAYLQQAYDLAYLSQTEGAGTTIAIVDAYDDPNAESDLATYRTNFDLPACTTANGCFKKVDQDGVPVDQSGGDNALPANSTWDIEISLDLDAVSALCPNCHIVLVEANSASSSDLTTAEQEADTLGANVISDSWAMPQTRTQAQQNFDGSTDGAGLYSFPSVTTVAASGDDGYAGTSTNSYPAALPGVTAVGGTSLVPASTSNVQTTRGFTESAWGSTEGGVWSGTGSGCASAETKPTWQTDSGCHGRSYNDISADGDPETGIQIYDSSATGSNTGWIVVGGTSEATPLIAAYYALVGAQAQGAAWAYSNASLLNDITTGSNVPPTGVACAKSISYICNAGVGYDGPTGEGSISGAAATGAPGIGGPGTSGSYLQSVTQTTAQLEGGIYPNGADTKYWWEYGTTTNYGQTTKPTTGVGTDIGSGTSPVAVNDSLTGLQPSTTYHYRLVAQNSYGTEYGYDFTLTTNASPAPTSGGGTATNPPIQTTPPPTTTTPVAPTPPASTASATPTVPQLGGVQIASAGATTATARTTINAGGGATTYELQYGSTPALGHSMFGGLPASLSPVTVSRNLQSLSPGKVYYVRTVASNAAGTSMSAMIRFRTSPVTITRIFTSANKLEVVLRCHGSSACSVRLQARVGGRLIAAGGARIRGNRSATATLNLSRSAATLVKHGRAPTLSVLSVWNGLTATVSARI